MKYDDKQKCELLMQEIEKVEIHLTRKFEAEFYSDGNSTPIVCALKDKRGILWGKTLIADRINKPTSISPSLLPDKCVVVQELV